MNVLVGIPTLNGPDRLERCLHSITACTDWKRWEGRIRLLVCDDRSTEENLKLNKDAVHRAAFLRDHARLEMLMNQERSGIATSWNKLVRHEASDVSILVNDDIEVVRDWLEVLVYSVMENEHAGMVSLPTYLGLTKGQVMALHPECLEHEAMPHVDYREGRLQDGGGNLLTSGGAVFAFRRDVFEEAGGFDERYFCFYEEVDFGVTLRHRGYLHYVAAHPIVYHMGGATMSAPEMKASEHLKTSQERFYAKWGKTTDELRKALTPCRRAVREWNSQLEDFRD